MARFFSMIYGASLVAILVAGAAAQNVPHRPSHRPRPQRNMDAQAPDENPAVSMTSQNAPFVAGQMPQARPTPPQPPPQAAAPTPNPTPDPALQVTENLPPAVPAQVTYQNGMLTVQAMNSTLGALLMAIRNKTGIQFEGLEGGASERVVISMGPAPEGEVLNAILRGSKFDYVVLDRPDSPGIVQRVLLSLRGGTPAVAGAQPHPATSGEDDDDAPEEQVSTGDPEPQNTPAQPRPPDANLLMQQLQQMQERQRLLQEQQQKQQMQNVPPQPLNQAPIKQSTIPQ